MQMKSMLVTAPIVPGKLDDWRRFVDACLVERRRAYQHALVEGGLTRLRVWHAQGPDGSHSAVVLYDGPAPERFLPRMMTAPDDFAAWFRQQSALIHGVDPSAPLPPMPELAIDVSAE